MKTSDIKVELIGHFGDDNTVVNAARVSFHKDSCMYTDEENGKLLNYLARNGHHSPFNHAFLSFRVKAPIFVARQLVKHKFLPWNEVSRRYVDDEPEFYIPKEFRNKAENVKQGSEGVHKYSDLANDYLETVSDGALVRYKDMISLGVCPEQARIILPLNTMTEWVWSGTLGAFLDMLKLRLDPHTQKETRDTAALISYWVHKHFPTSYKANINV